VGRVASGSISGAIRAGLGSRSIELALVCAAGAGAATVTATTATPPWAPDLVRGDLGTGIGVPGIVLIEVVVRRFARL
jgi:hypothetical protein